MSVHVPVASSAASDVTWRSVRSDVVPRVLWGLPENIAADIRLVGPWCSLSGPCNGPLRTSTCMVTRQLSAQITWHPTSAALADIPSQRTMPSACGGARPSSSAVRTEPASVPVSFRPPGCSPTTDLARFGSAVQRLSRAASRSVTGLAVLVPIAVRRASDSVPRLTAHVCFAASGAGRVAPCGDGRAGPVSAFDHHGPVLPCDAECLARCRRRDGSGAEHRSMIVDRCCHHCCQAGLMMTVDG
jgi:hypothetical protein